VLFHLSQGDVWKTADHPDQKIYFVMVEDYVYLIPYKIERDYISLKTIIPSRQAPRDYKREQEE